MPHYLSLSLPMHLQKRGYVEMHIIACSELSIRPGLTACASCDPSVSEFRDRVPFPSSAEGGRRVSRRRAANPQ